MAATPSTGHAQGLGIGRLLRDRADLRPDAPFVVTAGGSGDPVTLTYADLADRAALVAGLLRSLGVASGDAVHVQLRNGPDFLACFFGITHLGAVVVPTNPSATVDDVAYVTSHAGCAVSVVAADLAPVVLAARDMAPDIVHVLAVGGAVDDAVDFSAALAAATAVAPLEDVDEADTAAVLYTSGTTGWPKGVMVTHANFRFAGEAVSAHVRMRPDDRWLVTLPLFHMNALGYSTMSALTTGASVALVERFEPAAWAAAAAQLDTSLASLFAVHVRQLLDAAPGPHDGALRLRTVIFAQHLTPGERETFAGRFGADLRQVYGLTETIAPTLGDPPYGRQRPEMVGRAMLWARVKVTDRAGREVPDGTEGELRVSGDVGRTLMAGYSQRPEETAMVLGNGWLRTGDRFVREGDGWFRFLGRATEVIKPGVDNVSAPEIERVLIEHVAVADAAVVGARTDTGDEAIVAFVVLRDDERDVPDSELLVWAGERLADYKVPHRIEVIDRLPRNTLGKVEKDRLQQMAEVSARGTDPR